jgi:hypothetical protein
VVNKGEFNKKIRISLKYFGFKTYNNFKIKKEFKHIISDNKNGLI